MGVGGVGCVQWEPGVKRDEFFQRIELSVTHDVEPVLLHNPTVLDLALGTERNGHAAVLARRPDQECTVGSNPLKHAFCFGAVDFSTVPLFSQIVWWLRTRLTENNFPRWTFQRGVLVVLNHLKQVGKCICRGDQELAVLDLYYYYCVLLEWRTSAYFP